MMLFCLVYLLLPVLLVGTQVTPGPVTRVRQGSLRGRWFTTRGGRRVAGFLGIPYAAPPVGDLRFVSPQPALPWAGTYSATIDGPACIQNVAPPFVPTRATSASEDCLYLNVFTPCKSRLDFKVTPIKKYPVLVFIYGGGFETGTTNSTIYGPEYLLDKDLILVTLSYRAGILGFLSMGDNVLPGNLGLKDQRAALRWVRDNIASFGGDPSQVTIFGQSAGAACVQFHLMFNNKKKLFRAGICNSGSSLTSFALQRASVQIPLVDKLANLTGCPRTPSWQLVECLRRVPAQQFETLRQEIGKTESDIKRHAPVFTPVIEPQDVADAFITGDPWHTPMSFPILQGVNTYDGGIRTNDFDVGQSNRKLMELNETYRNVLPYNLYFESTTKNTEQLAVKLKDYYFKNKTIDRKSYLQLVTLFSDALYNYPLKESTILNKGLTYFYQLNYNGSNSLVRFQGSSANYGAIHTDELFYLFPMGGPAVRNITAADTAFSKQMVTLWTNFVIYLNPTPPSVEPAIPTAWTPVITRNIEFLNITQTGFEMQGNFLKDRMDFWETVPFRKKIDSSSTVQV